MATTAEGPAEMRYLESSLSTQQTCQKPNPEGCQLSLWLQINFLIPKGPEGGEESQSQSTKCLQGRRLKGRSLGLLSRFRGG